MKLALFGIGIVGMAVIGIIYLLSPSSMPQIQQNQSMRPTYVNLSNDVFNDLPGYPENFVQVKRNFYDGQIKEIYKLNEEYWKQPEWYPTWLTNGLSWFENHDYSRWGVHGYGFFPSVQSYNVVNMSHGDTLTAWTIFHSSWGIESWQGIKIVPIYVTKYFTVSITPNVVLLEPTFPRFYRNWTHLIRYEITAKQKIPSGKYLFSVVINSPSEEQNNEWSWEVLDKQTKYEFTKTINECKKQLSEKCVDIVSLRLNKYIYGGQYAPSNLFDVTLNVE